MTKKAKVQHQVQVSPAEPNTQIAELFGYAPGRFLSVSSAQSIAGQCPIRDSVCDVSANRHQVAHLDLDRPAVHKSEKQQLLELYGTDRLPLGICSCWTKRQNETVARPWILCPKRLLALEPPKPVIPKEVRDLIEIQPGTRVGVWRELKLRKREAKSARFFEYTFDYLLMALDEQGSPVGVPYIIEVMTSSTRGGGLTEHMVDVLLGRKQRNLTGVVKSVYTPNYRQIFERMLGQFIAKSEVAAQWGGKTIWVFQDVLLDYIEQTTDFDSRKIMQSEEGNVFVEIYGLLSGPPRDDATVTHMHLAHHKSLRGEARRLRENSDYTSMLGLGYAPSLDDLKAVLKRNSAKAKKNTTTGWFSFRWGEERDPRSVNLD